MCRWFPLSATAAALPQLGAAGALDACTMCLQRYAGGHANVTPAMAHASAAMLYHALVAAVTFAAKAEDGAPEHQHPAFSVADAVLPTHACLAALLKVVVTRTASHVSPTRAAWWVLTAAGD